MTGSVNAIDLSGFMIGEVRDNVDSSMEGKIGCYIPRLMYEGNLQGETLITSVDEISTNNLLNSSEFTLTDYKNDNLQKNNLIWLRPSTFFDDSSSSGSMRIPQVGTTVFVIFLDNDPQKGYYLPFSPTFAGDKISNTNSIINNIDIPARLSNVDVIRSYSSGVRIEVNNNPGEECVIFSVPADKTKEENIVKKNRHVDTNDRNNNYIKLSGDGIELHGNISLSGNINGSDSVNVDGDYYSYDVGFLYHNDDDKIHIKKDVVIEANLDVEKHTRLYTASVARDVKGEYEYRIVAAEDDLESTDPPEAAPLN